MTDVYTQESASKKKFLAPLLVILLCMVSLTAAGYAYSATVDNEGSDVVSEGISIQLLNSDDSIVDKAMYDLQFALGTHTVNGRAIYDGQGFHKDDKALWNVAADDGVDETKESNVITDFETGYYVDVGYRNGSAGSFTPVDGTETEFGDAYKVVTENRASSEVTLTLTAIVNGTVPDFVDELYLVITDGAQTPKEITVHLKGDTSADVDHVTLAANAVETFTVQAYFIANDFYASQAEVGELLPVAGCTFDLHFEAATATP